MKKFKKFVAIDIVASYPIEFQSSTRYERIEYKIKIELIMRSIALRSNLQKRYSGSRRGTGSSLSRINFITHDNFAYRSTLHPSPRFVLIRTITISISAAQINFVMLPVHSTRRNTRISAFIVFADWLVSYDNLIYRNLSRLNNRLVQDRNREFELQHGRIQ